MKTRYDRDIIVTHRDDGQHSLTLKQVRYLQYLGYEGPYKDLSRLEASRLITELEARHRG